MPEKDNVIMVVRASDSCLLDAHPKLLSEVCQILKRATVLQLGIISVDEDSELRKLPRKSITEPHEWAVSFFERSECVAAQARYSYQAIAEC